MTQRRWFSAIALAMVFALFAVACGDGDGAGQGDGEAAGSEAGDGELTKVDAMFPVNSPILHGVRVAQEAGYFEDEGLEVNAQFLAGGGEVITQLVAGNADIGNIPVSVVVEGLEQGNEDLRAVYNVVYGSIFYIAVPADSDIQDAADLAGKKIGVTDMAGGEVPIVNGIAKSGGLTENDIEIVPVGEGTALAIKALTGGEIDAFGGAVQDIIALEGQDLDLRYILPDELLELPASGIVVKQEYLDNNRETLEGFVRALTKGYYWARVNPDATLAVLKKVTPEQFTDDTGEKIFEAVLPITWAPEGTEMGFQSPDTWAAFFEFVGAEPPDTDLSEIVIDDLVEAGNDFDTEAVEEDANSYEP